MNLRYASSVFLLVFGLIPPANAISNNSWSNISDATLGITVVGALGIPTIRGDWQGLGQAALSDVVASGASQLLKATIHEQRPDHSDDKSFPSGHATLAFASATTLNRRYGWEIGFPAYGFAALTGIARVAARKHHWWDVGAGAALGSASGWYFTDALNDKVQLTPWVEGRSGGMLISGAW
ncbi:phosphatase PAP2 family protein [Ferrigenium sp. UT5]|uniref:phosphatase PAP2 family protein n=1 Tax=Ferrigenium sp. UT5 TaxID=3242105 RepID=UPI00354F97E3